MTISRMSKSPTEYLKHILDEIDFLEREIQGYTEDQFMRDELKQRAFARSLEIIGEAVKMIPDESLGCRHSRTAGFKN